MSPKRNHGDMMEEFFDGTIEWLQTPEQINEHKRVLEEEMREHLQDCVDHCSITPERMNENLTAYHRALWRMSTDERP